MTNLYNRSFCLFFSQPCGLNFYEKVKRAPNEMLIINTFHKEF